MHLQGEYFKRSNKICDIHGVVCFMPKDRILFGQTSYQQKQAKNARLTSMN